VIGLSNRCGVILFRGLFSIYPKMFTLIQSGVISPILHLSPVQWPSVTASTAAATPCARSRTRHHLVFRPRPRAVIITMPPKIYTVNGPSSTSTSTLPTWLTTKTRPSKKHNIKRSKTQHSVGQLELIQDFAFPETAFKIKTTEDGLYAVGTGSYKPMMKVWDLEGLTVKFERVTDSENVDFVVSLLLDRGAPEKRGVAV
jgi:hypothetical protein